MLLGYGLTVFRVEEVVRRLARCYDLDVSTLGLPTTMVISADPEGRGQTFHIVQARPDFADLGRLVAVYRLIGALERQELDAHRALDALRAVLASRPAWPAWLGWLAVGLCGASSTRLLGGDLLDTLGGGLGGLLVGGILLLVSRFPRVAQASTLLCALLVSAGASLGAELGWLGQPGAVMLSSLLMLLPGFSLTVAALELASGHPVCGTSRLVASGSVLLQLGFGVMLGARLLGGEAVLQIGGGSVATGEALVLGIGLAVGFGVLLKLRPAHLLPATTVALGAIALSRLLSGRLSPAEGAFATATCLTLVSHLVARWRDVPVSVFLLPGIFMLVPGCLGLMGASALLADDPTHLLRLAREVVLIVVGISAGVVVGSSIVPPHNEL